MNKYAGFFAAYNASIKGGNPLSKEEVVLEFTEGRTASLKDLTIAEYEALVSHLNKLSGFNPVWQEEDQKRDRMRKSIIAIFKKMGRTTAAAIAWAEKQGVKGVKKPINDYTAAELFVLIRVAEKVFSDWQVAIRKNLTKM